MIFQKVVIFITLSYVATTLAGGVNQNKDLPLKPSALDLSLFNFMARSASIMQKNPSRSASCTDYYLPLIECIIREYEQNGKACNDDAAAKRAEVEAETVENQENLADSADSACGEVVQCKERESAESILQCYVDEGLTSSKGLTALSNDANLKSRELNNSLRTIDSSEQACLTQSRFDYERDIGAAYDDFNDCIMGSLTPPSAKSVSCGSD